MLDFADPPALTFASTVWGSTSADSPQTVTLENVGNAPLSFPIPATGNNPSIAPNFTLNSSLESACPLLSSGSSGPGTLAVGASCVLPISFTPAAGGTFNGSLVLTDNNLNAAAPSYATQSITLSGTGTQVVPVITWSAPAAITYGTALSATQLNASSTIAGTFTYSPAAGTVLAVGSHTLMATFTPTDTTDYADATATVTLTVNPAPSFSLSASPASVTVSVSATGNSTISVSDQNGFSGNVTLTASGLPAGVSAAFSKNPTAGTSVLTLTASKKARAGTTSVTIQGASGTLTATTNIALTVKTK